MENKDVIAVNSIAHTENQCVVGGDINSRYYSFMLNLI